MRINNNLNAMTALNQMGKNTAMAGTSMNKISSGERINKAGDDAAGMAISEKMRAQMRGLDQASKNAQDGVSVVQTAEGAMEEIGNIAQRMRELTVQSANETNGADDRQKIVEELTQLHEEIDRIADSTQFNKKDLLNGDGSISGVRNSATGTSFTVSGFDTNGLTTAKDIKLTVTVGSFSGATATSDTKVEVNIGGTTYTGILDDADALAGGEELTLTDADGNEISFKATQALADGETETIKAEEKKGSSLTLQVGANSADNQTLSVEIANVKTAELGLSKEEIGNLGVDGEIGTKAANNLVRKLDLALESINTNRANLGAMQNRLETAQSNLTTSSENLTAAESRIRDVDVAKEMMNLSKLNLLSQASQAMAAQAKQQPEGVMQLLR